MIQEFIPKIPVISSWIDNTIRSHRDLAKPVTSFGFSRLPGYYSERLLSSTSVVIVDGKVPMPPLAQIGLSQFRSLEDRQDLIGITYKDTYFVVANESGSESLHFNELVHVVQWAHLGVDRFLLAYAAGLLQCGYDNSPLERMSYRYEADFKQGKKIDNLEKAIRNELDTNPGYRINQPV